MTVHDTTMVYAEVPATPSLVLGAADFTIEAWVEPGVYRCIYLIAGHGYGVYVDSYGVVYCWLWGDGYAALTSNAALSPFTWGHIALVRTGEIVTLFVNGAPDNSVQYIGSLSPTPATLTIGPFSPSTDPNTGYWTGPVYINEVSITVTPPPPPELRASSYIPQEFDPEVADTIQKRIGVRS
jgi:hypothetical protein